MDSLAADGSASQELAQTWDALVGILDQLAEILGDITLPIKEMRTLLGKMIDRVDLGHIPHGDDQITFGGAKRIRLSNPKVVFIIGAADGEFPAIPSGAGVFTDDERRRLHNLGLPVADRLEDQFMLERLIAYSALSAASDMVYIMYPNSPLKPGDITTRKENELPELPEEVRRCIPDAVVLRERDIPLIEKVEGAAAAFELACLNISAATPELAALVAGLSEIPGVNARLQAIQAAALSSSEKIKSRALLQTLFGDKIMLSSSKIDTYYRCGFEYFCKYLLRANPPRKVAVDPLEYGHAVHYILEKLMSERPTEEFVALAASDALSSEISRTAQQYLAENMDGAETKDARFLFIFNHILSSVMSIVVNLADEISAGKFVPSFFELEINKSIELSDGTMVALDGKVDRVDIYIANGKQYLRVFDYKTGNKSFKLSDILAGLNIQMLLYLSILCERTAADPAGALYCPASSGIVNTSRNADDFAVRTERGKQHRRSGLLVDDTEDFEILQAMEENLSEKFIPVKANKVSKNNIDITLSEKSLDNIISTQEFTYITRYIESVIHRMCSGLKEGEIHKNPVRMAKDECDYCDYYAICRYTGNGSKVSETTNMEALERMIEGGAANA